MIQDATIALGAYLLSGIRGYRQAGIHNYIKTLLAHLPDAAAQASLDLIALISPTALDEVPSEFPHVVATAQSLESPRARIREEQLRLPAQLRQLRAALYHGMAFAAPLSAPCKTVVTVHDLSFITQPHTHKRFNRMYLSQITRLSCRRATRIIAVSQHTRDDVSRFFGIAPERIDVIAHGVDGARFAPLSPDEIAVFRTQKNIAERAVFYLGSVEPRKNLITLIEAFTRVCQTDTHARLYVGGGLAWKYEAILTRAHQLGIGNRVTFLDAVAPEELPLWFAACDVFVYPSLYEGFGMPVLEAMACGAPIVSSNVTSLPEVVGDAGILVSPTDVDALADAIARVLTDDGLRAELRSRSLQRAAQFTWQRAAQQTVETYIRALQIGK